MSRCEFVAKVQAMEIANGTKFEVYDKNDIKLGTIGVIDSTVVFLNMPVVPNDLYIGEYTFKEVREEK